MEEKRPPSRVAVKRSYVRHLTPMVVWLGAVMVVGWLFYQRSESFQMVGIAQSEVRQVASDCTARIVDIRVDLFEPVTAGQVLAVLNTVPASELTTEAELQAQVATAAAEIERLMASLIPTQDQLLVEKADLQISHADNQRRFIVDAEAARLHVLQIQTEIASEEILLNGLAVDVQATEKLVQQEVVVPFELEKLKIQYDSTARKIKEYQVELEQAQADQAQAERRRDEFAQQQLPQQSIDDALEAIRKEARVQEELMKGLRAQIAAFKARSAVEVKSPIDGVVIPISGRANEVLLKRQGEETIRRAGEVVSAGDPILAVAQTQPTEIVAYANEQQVGYLKDDMTVELVKMRYPAQIAQSNVRSIGPTIELLPQRLWRSPTIPQWGRPVVIAVPPGLDLVPGELVGVRGL
ncbi:MAG TPA: HlyD family efflux transporter periplasmic adaptor subunit [Sedimentisphaerales bacterium]|jgi:multidrug resistance efflux pump|nr:HlyD family efflux transporter periplasmic adaptor subunit [Sedimentisphaerales bacterium]